MPKYAFISKFNQAFDTSSLSEEEVKKAGEPWFAWFASMGSAVQTTAAFKFGSKTVSQKGSKDGDNLFGGYIIVEADDLDAAAELAKGAPNVTAGQGSIEVYEILPTDK